VVVNIVVGEVEYLLVVVIVCEGEVVLEVDVFVVCDVYRYYWM